MQRSSKPPGLPVQPMQLGAAEWTLLLLHSALWGSAFFFVDLAKEEIAPFSITALRLGPAVLVLVAVAAIAGISLRPLIVHWRKFLVLAFVNNWLPFVLIVYAQAHVTGGIAAVFNATTPLFALILAHLLTKDEKLTALRLVGVLIGIAGVAVLTGGSLVEGAKGSLLANACLLLAALCYALAGIYSRSMPRLEPIAIATGQMVYALLLAIPLMLVVDRPWQSAWPSNTALAAVVAMGVFGSAFAAICFFTLIRRSGATNALLVTLLLPLTPIVLGSIFLGHRLDQREIAGAIIIALALLVIDGRLLRRLSGRSRLT